MSETYTSGRWIVKAGEEEAFVQDWKELVSWASNLPGAGTFRLVRDAREPSNYLSFGDWESLEAQRAWTEQPEFPERLDQVRRHCTDFYSSAYELVTEV